MLSIDTKIVSYLLAIRTSFRTLVQRKLEVGQEKRVAIDEDIKNLYRTRFITYTKYPTWGNVVLVQKPNNKWRMCVEFRYLNASFPKDLYSLLDIIFLIDGSSG